MKVVVVLLAASWILGAVWNARAEVAAAKPAGSPSPLVAGNNQFAFDLYRRLTAESSGDVFVSPESISLALAMTYSGARGQTAEQMAKTLHFTQPAEQLDASFATILKQLNSGGAKHEYQLSIANRLWAQQGYKFLDEFLTVTREQFGAELAQLDFVRQTEAARQTINTWVEKQTNDKIKDLIPAGAVGADTRLVLTNAIYFKGDWQIPFGKEATSAQPFHLSAEKTADVQMMHQEAHFSYSRLADLQVLAMPYKGRDLSMIVLLPAKVDGLADLEKSLSSEDLQKWIGGLKNQEVVVSMPKYKVTREVELSKILSAMGMPLAFTAGRADFSGMNGRNDLFISAVIHKAYVEVDEKGTEAAAATAIGVRVMAMPVRREPERFVADHPFIFLIRDTNSGSILFLGRFTGPTTN
jgi:serpin B